MSALVSAHIRPVQHSLHVYGTQGSLRLDIGARTCVPLLAQTLPSAVGRLWPAWSEARHYRRNAWSNVRRFGRHEFHFFQGMRVLLRGFYGAILEQNEEPISNQIVQRTADTIDVLVESIYRGPAEVRP